MAERSVFRRLSGGLGRGIDVVRTWLGRLFFLLALVVVLFVLFSSPGPVQVPSTAALVLAPTGNIVEKRDSAALGMSFLTGPVAQDTELRELLDAIDTAADDERIASLVLSLDDMTGISPAQLETLGNALERFRESDKPIHAYGDYFSQGQYALAAHADSITLHPLGNVLLPGYGGNQLFFSGLLERLNVNVHVFRVGEFKSAAEPYTRMDLSDEARADNQALVDALWQRYIEQAARARDLDPDTITDYTMNLPERVGAVQGDMARAALDQGLVDELAGIDEFRQRMASRVGSREEGSFRQIHFRDYLATTATPLPSPQPQVAVLVAEGTIMSGPYAPGVISDEDMVQRIRRARNDNNIRALVLRVNSPGGGMLASEAIRSELALMQAEGKPVVASMGGTAASGGYWISATADQIWASPATVTGSIGVISVVPTFEDALSEVGVGTDGVGTTPLTLGSDPLGGLSDSMQQLLQQSINHAYERFITLVADGRSLPRDEVEALAGGRVMTGAEALEAGLVDATGDLEQAIEASAELADLDDWQAVSLERPRSLLEQFLEQAMQAGSESPAMQGLVDTVAGPLGLVYPERVRGWQPLMTAMRQSGSSMPRAWLLCELCVSLSASR